MYATSTNSHTFSGQSKKNSKSSGHRIADMDSESDENKADPLFDSSKPWLAEFNCYITTVESVPEEMGIVHWWGVRDCLFYYLQLSYFRSSLILSAILSGLHWLETIWL